MLLKKLTPVDTNFLRGLAILAIVLHNYFHILQQAPGENEFTFSISNTYTFLYNLKAAPLDILKQLFSFFGHYGVQIFVFLSGYGLATKCTNEEELNFNTFFLPRFKKIYPVLFLAVMLLFFYKAAVTLVFPAKEIDLVSFAQEAFLKITLVSNLIPGEALSISGPWWFFSLIIQLYLVAPFLLKLQNINYLFIIILLSWLIQVLFLVYSSTGIAYLRVNLPGHLPEFCLGIYTARTCVKRINTLLLVLVVFVFILGSFNQYVWVISFLCVPVLALAADKYVLPYTGRTFRGAITFFGKNSLYLFAIHGLCRAPFVPLGNRSVFWSVLASLAYLLVVTVLALLFKYIVNSLQLLIANGFKRTLSEK